MIVRASGLALNLAKPVSLYALLFILLRLRPELPAVLYLALAAALGFMAWRYLDRRSDYRLFAPYILAFGLFNGLRIFADNTGQPVSYTYPIDLDVAVFGAVPTVWLQERLYAPGSEGLIDAASSIVYTIYFSFHFLVAAVLWSRHSPALRLYVGAIVATLFLGLAIYYLLPTAPPWLASEAGHLTEVTRIAKVMSSELWQEAYSRGSYVAGTNDVAAMPSLHVALTAVIALVAARGGRLWGTVGWAYVAAMGFALVYLGEHYVVDIVAGIATAVVAWRLVLAGGKRLGLGARSAGTDPLVAVVPEGVTVRDAA